MPHGKISEINNNILTVANCKSRFPLGFPKMVLQCAQKENKKYYGDNWAHII